MPDAVAADLPEIIRSIEPRLPFPSIQRGDAVWLQDAGLIRLMAMAIGGLGTVALALAATGLYAVMAYAIAMRRNEIGVRMAVGATPRTIVGMILRQALSLAVVGGIAGLAIGVPLSFALRALLVMNFSPVHPLVYAPALLFLFLAAGLAAAIPARRASHVDPAIVLRQP